MSEPVSFPRQQAVTRRFTCGRPRAFTVAPSGEQVLFLRSPAGDDPRLDLWCFEVASSTERRLVAASTRVGGDADLTPEERARRERAREVAGGIVRYATDRDVTMAAFVLDGQLCTVDVDDGALVVEQAEAGVFDPRPSPDGRRVAYCASGALHVLTRGSSGHVVASDPDVTWGLAEFVAAEEMGRLRGYWWSPDSTRLLAARVDAREVPSWWIADPAQPAHPAVEHRYPVAGGANAEVGLAIVDADSGARTEVTWDASTFPYLAAVTWTAQGPPTLLVQTRDQRRWQVLAVDEATGATHVVREDEDPAWLELVDGVPAWLTGERLVMVVDTDRGEGGTRSVVVDGAPVTPPGLQVRRVVASAGDTVFFTASGHDPADVQLYRCEVPPDGPVELERCSVTDGVHDGAVGGDVAVLVSATFDAVGSSATVLRGEEPVATLTSYAQRPVVHPNVELLTLTPRRLRAALLRPHHGPAADGDGALPVLLDPYGGPHSQRVLKARGAYLTPQWFADQGFAVLVVDGAGTPGRGPVSDREVSGDLATPVLDDQVAALHAAAEHEPRLDLDRVAIRGWSFGGYLAALAVLRRPDVFRAGIAGAPVTDWRLYDTHYTERYLGHPDTSGEAYRISSLVDAGGDLVDAVPPPEGSPPPALMVIHGLADDNVVAAHSLRLSAALLAAGRPHRFLPLSGVTHMTPQEVVAENLLRLQLDFLREALG